MSMQSDLPGGDFAVAERQKKLFVPRRDWLNDAYRTKGSALSHFLLFCLILSFHRLAVQRIPRALDVTVQEQEEQQQVVRDHTRPG